MGIDRHYLQTWIYADVEREINLAKEGRGGGNYLTALGLVCYTEYVGGLMFGGDFGLQKGSRNFNEAFRELGKPYVRFMQRVHPLHGPVYDVLRSGFAHQYTAKASCEVSMLRGDATAGVGFRPDGVIAFNVEAYFDDFKAMCNRLMDAGRLTDRGTSDVVSSSSTPSVVSTTYLVRCVGTSASMGAQVMSYSAGPSGQIIVDRLVDVPSPVEVLGALPEIRARVVKETYGDALADEPSRMERDLPPSD